MATLQGKAVKNTYRQVLQIGANNVGVSASLQPVQDGAGVNTALSLSTLAATVNGDLTITGDLIITGGGIQIKDLIDDTVAALIQNGTGITWTYNDGAATLTGNFTGTTSVVPEGSNLYYTQGRFDSAFAAKSTTNLAEGTNLYFTEARGNANFATNLAASDTNDLAEGSTNLYYTNARARTALSVTAGTGLSYDNTTGVFNLAAIPNASLTNSSITINGQAVSLGGTVTLTTTNIAEGTNLYWTTARGNANFATNLAASTTTNLAEGTNLYYTQARFDTAFSNKSTTNLAEGTNLYYTQARFNSALAAKTTTDLAEGTNLYYTDARARLALSSSATGLSYANNSGVFSLTAGYAIPTTVKLGEYDIAYNRSIVSAAVTGTSTKTLSLTQQDANVITATWTDQGITTINGTANQIAATTVGNTTTLGFTNDVTMPNNLVVSGNLTINGTATYVNTESISSKDPLFEVANTNNTTDAVDIGYYGRYYDAIQERVEFTGLFRDASDAGKFKIFSGLVDEPTNVVNTTGTGYTVATLVANVDGNLAGTANAANILSTARTIAASGDAAWSVSFDGSANVTSALTLANTGVTATTYGTSTAVPTIAVDSKGRITSASNTNITFPVTSVNGAGGTVVLTTTNISEGTNQYFTTGRVSAYLTGAISTVLTADLTASRAVASNASGKLVSSGTTDTELGYLSGVTSAVQTQLNSKLNLSGGTLTGGLSGTTGTFSGILTTPQVKAATSAGLSINANSGTQVADFGAGGSANLTLFGGLSGTSATFSSTLGVTGALSGTSATFSGALSADQTDGGTIYTKTAGALVGLLTNTFQIAGSGTKLDLNAYVYGANSFGVWTNAIKRLTIDANGLKLTGNNIATPNTLISEINNYAGTSNQFKSSSIKFFTGTFVDQGFITFNTSISGSDVERLRISENGAVGMNTNSPDSSTVLTLRESGTLSGAISFVNRNNNQRWSIAVDATAVDDKIFAIIDNSNATVPFKIAHSTGAATFTNDITTNDGQVRLRTTNKLILGYDQAGGASLNYNSNGNLDITPRAGYATCFTSGDTLFGKTTNGLTTNGIVIYNTTSEKGQIFSSITNSANTYHVWDTTNGAFRFYVSGGGTINASNPVISVISDGRLKENITDLEIGLNAIMSLRPRKYDWKKESGNTGKNIRGFIAQEFEQIFPDLIDESLNKSPEGEPYKQIRQDLIPVLVKAIQEQQAQIEELKAMIAAK